MKTRILAFLASLCIAASAFGQTVFPAVQVNGQSDLRGNIVNGTGVVTVADDLTVNSGGGATELAITAGSVTAGVKLSTFASASGAAGLNIAPGTAPSSPANGDVWVTSSGFFVQANGSTVGPLISSAGVTTAALTKVDDTNVTLTLGGSPTTALLNAASLTLGWSGNLSVARGGSGVGTLTGLLLGNGTSAFTALTATDDSIPVGNGSTYQVKTVPNCTDTGGNHLNYTQSTNAFSCGTSSSGGGGGTPGGADTQVQFNNMGSFGGSSDFTWDGSLLTTLNFEATGQSAMDGDLDVTGQITAAGSSTNYKSAVSIENNDPRFLVIEDDAAANNKAWVMGAASATFNIFACDDGGPATCNSALKITRSGATPSAVQFNSIDMTPATGTFTFTWDLGCTTSPTQAVTWVRNGNMVTISATGASFTCTNDAVAFQDTSNPMPAAIRPSGSRIIYGNPIEVNGALVQNSCITVFSAGTIAFRPVNTVTDLNCLGSLGSSGTTGLPQWTITYGL